MSLDDVIKILNKNAENRNYSKVEAKQIYDFIKMVADNHVAKRLNKN